MKHFQRTQACTHPIFILILTTSTLLLSCGPQSTLPTPTQQSVNIPDPNLRAKINEALRKASGASITNVEIASLPELDARNANISNLTGLELATNLTELYLQNNSVSDIIPLQGLTKLEVLRLGNNSVSDITPLKGLTKLTKLGLQNNSVSDITPLKGLTKLEVLGLGNNLIADIAPLKGLTKLTKLWLDENSISDIKPLEGLTKLTELGLYNNKIKDIKPLAKLRKLTKLGLYNNKIKDIKPLEELTKLTELGLSNNKISDITPLKGLTKLEGLGLNNNLISGITPLEKLTKLTKLRLNNTNLMTKLGLNNNLMTKLLGLNNNLISDITPLEELTKLTELYLQNNSVSDIKPLGKLTKLEVLELNNNSISDIKPLEGLTKLTKLWLYENSISDIKPLEGLTKLTKLELSNNKIKDIKPLEGLTKLTELGLRNNSVSDITPLKGLTKLTELGLHNNSISDIKPLAKLHKLTKLRLNSNSISDITPLGGLTKLEVLALQDNSISDITPLGGLTKLEVLVLRDNDVSNLSPLEGLTKLKLYSDLPPLVRVGEPRTVQLIYFVPNGRPYRKKVVEKMKDEICDIQTFYAEQMQAHGYGPKTFRFETDQEGKAVVYYISGKRSDGDYLGDPFGTISKEIERKFDTTRNIYFVVLDKGTERINRGSESRGKAGVASRWGNGGVALVTDKFKSQVAAHELGHAFGLEHGFSDDVYIMSYGNQKSPRLSASAAKFLTTHPYFNTDIKAKETGRSTVELISQRGYPGGSKSVPIQFEVSDPDGLHQVLLFVKTQKPHPASGSWEVKAWRGLNAEKEAVIEFDYDGIIPSDTSTNLSDTDRHPIYVWVVDTFGNLRKVKFELISQLARISGDNQWGTLEAPLANPFVVQVSDRDGAALEGVSVTFTVTAGGGTLSVRSTTTDASGRARSTLTLGPNSEMNTVEVTAAGFEGKITFNAKGETVVNLPDPKLRDKINEALRKSPVAPITDAEMASLEILPAQNANICNLTGLEFATNLIALGLNNNEIKDIASLKELTKLEMLLLGNNRIEAITPLEKLTQLTLLVLNNNKISDLKHLADNVGLTDGDTVDVTENPLSDLSIKTHIPTLERRGVKVDFR